MPVDDIRSIDYCAIDNNGNAVLVISDHLEWDKKNKHILILQNKINAYLEGIENGALYSNYPAAKGKKIVIKIMAKYNPDANGTIFLQHVKKRLEAAGYELDFSVPKI